MWKKLNFSLRTNTPLPSWKDKQHITHACKWLQIHTKLPVNPHANARDPSIRYSDCHACMNRTACTRRNHAWHWHPFQIFPPAQNSRSLGDLLSVLHQGTHNHLLNIVSRNVNSSQCSLWLPATEQSSMHEGAGFFCIGSKWCVWTGEMSRSGCMPSAHCFSWFHFSLAHSHGLVSPCLDQIPLCTI